MIGVIILVVLALGVGFWLGRSQWFSSKVEPEVDDLLHEASQRLAVLRATVSKAEQALREKF